MRCQRRTGLKGPVSSEKRRTTCCNVAGYNSRPRAGMVRTLQKEGVGSMTANAPNRPALNGVGPPERRECPIVICVEAKSRIQRALAGQPFIGGSVTGPFPHHLALAATAYAGVNKTSPSGRIHTLNPSGQQTTRPIAPASPQNSGAFPGASPPNYEIKSFHNQEVSIMSSIQPLGTISPIPAPFPNGRRIQSAVRTIICRRTPIVRAS